MTPAVARPPGGSVERVARDARRAREAPGDWAFPLALFAVAFVLRFAVASFLAGEPVWDGHYYDFGARRIAEGHGYSDDRTVGGVLEWHPWCHYPVGYSGYLAAFYFVFGARPWTLHLANALAGALVPLAVFHLGRAAFDRDADPGGAADARGSSLRAKIAGGLAALHPGLVLYGALVMGEVLSALTVMVAFWATLRLVRTRPWFQAVGAGALLLGVGALVRPQALLCAPFLALAIPLDRVGGWLFRGKAALLACALALVPVLPWTARNCAVMDGCALVSTNAGWNLAIGAFPRATGRFETLRSSDGCREVTGQVQQDRCWLEYGLANIRREPGRWLGLIPAKLGNTFDHESFAVEYLREARPSAWPEARRVRWRSILSGFHRLLVAAMPFAFLGLVLPRPRAATKDVTRGARAMQAALAAGVVLAALLAFFADTPTFWPIVVGGCVLSVLPLPGRPPVRPALQLAVVLIASTALTHAVFFGDDRYHVVVTPALCLLAAAVLRRPRGAVPA